MGQRLGQKCAFRHEHPQLTVGHQADRQHDRSRRPWPDSPVASVHQIDLHPVNGTKKQKKSINKKNSKHMVFNLDDSIWYFDMQVSGTCILNLSNITFRIKLHT